MENELKGVIENVEIKLGSTEGKSWKRVLYTVCGQKGSCFEDFKEEGSDFSVGQGVRVELEKKGQYLNFKNFVRVQELDSNPDIKTEEIEDKPNSTLAPASEYKQVGGKLMVKVISGNNGDEFQKSINEFNAAHEVTHTQYQFSVPSNGTVYETWYSVMIFYKPETL